MFAGYHDFHAFRWNQNAKWILAVFWCCGLMFGLSAAKASETVLTSLMHQLQAAPVSIVGILLPDAFFLLITAFAVLIAKPWLFLPVAFFRAFSLGFYLEGLILLWQRHTWLWIVLYFPGLFSASILLGFCFRHIFKRRPTVRREWFLLVLVHVLTGLFQYDMALRFTAI